MRFIHLWTAIKDNLIAELMDDFNWFNTRLDYGRVLASNLKLSKFMKRTLLACLDQSKTDHVSNEV